MEEEKFIKIEYLDKHININFKLIKEEYKEKIKNLEINIFILYIYKLLNYLIKNKNKKIKISEKNNLIRFILNDNNKKDIDINLKYSFFKKDIKLDYNNIQYLNNIDIFKINEIRIYLYLNIDLNNNDIEINLNKEFNIFEDIYNKIIKLNVKDIKLFLDYYKYFIYDINKFLLDCNLKDFNNSF